MYKPNRGIHGASDNLWIRILTLDVRDCSGVSSEDMYVCFGSHIPHSSRCVPTGCDENVKGRVEANEREYMSLQRAKEWNDITNVKE